MIKILLLVALPWFNLKERKWVWIHSLALRIRVPMKLANKMIVIPHTHVAISDGYGTWDRQSSAMIPLIRDPQVDGLADYSWQCKGILLLYLCQSKTGKKFPPSWISNGSFCDSVTYWESENERPHRILKLILALIHRSLQIKILRKKKIIFKTLCTSKFHVDKDLTRGKPNCEAQVPWEWHFPRGADG